MGEIFLTPLEQPKMTPIGRKNGRTIYNLDEEYVYIWTPADKIKRKIIVKKGYRSDGASVPRFAWTLSGVTPDGLIRAAALVHDLLCEYKGKLPKGHYYELVDGEWKDCYYKRWSSKNSNKLFARIMRDFGVLKSNRRRAYLGVRIYRFFGGLGW